MRERLFHVTEGKRAGCVAGITQHLRSCWRKGSGIRKAGSGWRDVGLGPAEGSLLRRVQGRLQPSSSALRGNEPQTIPNHFTALSSKAPLMTPSTPHISTPGGGVLDEDTNSDASTVQPTLSINKLAWQTQAPGQEASQGLAHCRSAERMRPGPSADSQVRPWLGCQVAHCSHTSFFSFRTNARSRPTAALTCCHCLA